MEEKIIKAKGNIIFFDYIYNSIFFILINILYIFIIIDTKNNNIILLIIISIFILLANIIIIRKLHYINKCKVIFTKDSIILQTLKIKKKEKKDILPIYYVSSRNINTKQRFIREFKKEKILYKNIDKYGYSKDLDIKINYAKGNCFIIKSNNNNYYLEEHQFTKEQMNIINKLLDKKIKKK